MFSFARWGSTNINLFSILTTFDLEKIVVWGQGGRNIISLFLTFLLGWPKLIFALILKFGSNYVTPKMKSPYFRSWLKARDKKKKKVCDYNGTLSPFAGHRKNLPGQNYPPFPAPYEHSSKSTDTYNKCHNYHTPHVQKGPTKNRYCTFIEQYYTLLNSK